MAIKMAKNLERGDQVSFGGALVEVAQARPSYDPGATILRLVGPWRGNVTVDNLTEVEVL